MATAPGQPTSQALWRALTEAQRTILTAIAMAATAAGGAAYLVGGPVRDLLRGDPHLHDIDITTTVDARCIADTIAQATDGVVRQRTDFGTATIRYAIPVANESGDIDLATTRTETYATPGALPRVTFPASIEADLRRRDFTINALALPLAPGGFGPLVAAPHAADDLRDGRIRVLHDGSFRDDPTRLFRAIRYSARFGFALAPHTDARFAAAMQAGALATLSPARKRHEIEAGMREVDGAACLTAFAARRLLIATSAALIWDAWVRDRMSRILPLVREQVGERGREARAYWPAWACFVLRHGDDALGQLIADGLLTGGDRERVVRRLIRLWQSREAIAAGMPLSTIGRRVINLPEAVVAALFAGEAAACPLAAYYARHRQLLEQNAREKRVTGDDLARFGLPPDPQRRAVLDAVWAARLDGAVETHAEEIAFVERYVETRGLGR